MTTATAATSTTSTVTTTSTPICATPARAFRAIGGGARHRRTAYRLAMAACREAGCGPASVALMLFVGPAKCVDVSLALGRAKATVVAEGWLVSGEEAALDVAYAAGWWDHGCVRHQVATNRLGTYHHATLLGATPAEALKLAGIRLPDGTTAEEFRDLFGLGRAASFLAIHNI